MKHCLITVLLLFLFACNQPDDLSDLTFPNLQNEEVVLDIANNQLTVFYFLAPECPLSQNYTKEINEINRQFKSKQIGFYAVYSGTVYTEEEMKSYVEEYDITIEGLKDVNYVLSKLFSATITPEVFVINNQQEVVYSGKIDNWIESLGVKRQNVTEFYLKDALEHFITGQPIKITKTEAVGCVLE